MHFNVDIKDASGKVESWSFQGYSTLTMTRAGTSQAGLPRQHRQGSLGAGMPRPQRHDAQSRRGDAEVCRRPLRQVGQLQDNN